jgi:L-amino acid N-acyltransferase YncA
MAKNNASVKRDYPCTIKLEDGSEATLRLMTAEDLDRIVEFARSLPADDLLYLRIDITDPLVVAGWIENLEAGTTFSLIAEMRGEMAGYGSLHHSEVTWQRHLGEIRIQVAPQYRAHGLAASLTTEIFAAARDLGLRKIIAQMTPDQRAAMATFEKLGFQPEALLQDFVMDRNGRTRDLVIMGHDVEGLTDRVD